MEKIKKTFRNMSFRTSFILYVVIFTTVAILLISATITACHKSIEEINDSYKDEGEWYYLATADGELLDEGTKVYKNEKKHSEEDSRAITLLNAASYVCIPFFSIACLASAAALFYRTKMKKPLALLQEAYKRISDNDLDFSIGFASKDEMGNLCVSFEKMRAALLENNRQMWRQMEQRKRLNAAFAHDLRTPLTVLKGYSEILNLDGETQVTKDTASNMSKQISRLEKYVESMSNLQKLEDIEPSYSTVELSSLFEHLSKTSALLCEQAGKKVAFLKQSEAVETSLDEEMILTVVENLVSNAIRYSKSEILIDFTLIKDILTVTVKDDGRGFSPESARRAAEPYYTGDADRSSHFGLGLYICDTLCQLHGGCIQFGNLEHGAIVSATFKTKKSCC